MTRVSTMRLSFWGRVLPAVLTVGLLTGCAQERSVPERTLKPVRIMEVGDSVLPSREFFGTAQASKTVELAFRFGGRLIEFSAVQGERVEEGTPIGRLDPREWEAREAQIASELDSARAVLLQMQRGARAEDVERLKASLSARRAEASEASVQLDRLTKLFAERAISKSELDKAQLAFDVATANAAAVDLELQVAQNGARPEELEAKEAQIRGLEARLKEARENLADTILRAPFDGVVARTYVQQFEDVPANQPVVSIQDLSSIDIVIFVTEDDVARSQAAPRSPDLKSRTIAFAEFPALQNRRFPLRLKEFQTEADAATQTFKVILQMEQDETFPVKPGMNVVVQGPEGRIDGPTVVLIPNTALWGAPDGGKKVWVVDPQSSKVAARTVTTGRIIEGSVEITEGLKAGEKVAISAANLLREGMQVEPMKDLGAL